MTQRKVLIGAVGAATVLAVSGLLISQARPGGDQSGEREIKAGTVRGRLVYSSGGPADRVPVVLRQVDPPRRSARELTGADGRFEFKGLAGGAYRLFEVRVYVDGGKGQCEVLEKRDLRLDGKPVQLGDLKLARKTIMPIAD